MKYTILLAEDQTLIRDSLKMLLSEEADFTVSATAGDGEEALELCRKLKIDIALLDIRMPKMSGLEVAAALKKENLGCRIVLLTTFEEEKVFSEALSLGVHGIFLKDIEPELFAKSLRVIAGGLLVYHPVIGKQLSEIGKGGPRQDDIFGLTEKDLLLIRYIAEGMGNKAIAARFGCSEGTIKNRVSSVLGKMGLEDRTQIAVYAIKNGLIEDLD
ncbi:MAG: response regulator transcription factor [Spirochaetales bacterium]|nr:response regulator transcription factor [Spirochaetales bacterium]